MRIHLLAATALTTTITFMVPAAAFAQSTFDWNGFYVGLGLGAGGGSSLVTFDYSGTGPLPESVTVPNSGPSGSLIGGYNIQSGPLVFGLEANGSLVALSGSVSTEDYLLEDRISSLLSLRGRLGVAFDRLLVFGTAGLAAGNASFTAAAGIGDPVTASGIMTGTVVGAGTEFALTDRVKLTASTKLYNLSALSVVGDTGKGEGPDPYTATLTAHPIVFEAGVNVSF